MTIERRSVRVAGDNALGLIDRWHFQFAHIDRSPGGCITSFPPFPPSLFVRSEVEGDEQEQIRT